jgi:hypothetical protein
MPDPKNQIAFDELGLGGVLKHHRLQVPPNQREYSWTDREVTHLLQDFARAINEEGPYFLGAITTIPLVDGPLEVVDGQQRLATTAILLAAIRDYLASMNESILVESLNNEFLTGIDRKKRTRVAKLKLNVDDNDLFNRLVVGNSNDPLPEPVRTSHRLLLEAYDKARKHVRNILAPYDEREHGDYLENWVSFIEQRAVAVLLRVPSNADAYKMFETLNARGLPTSQVDLIKNHLFSRAGERFPEVQSRWSYMRGALETSEDEDITINFLRHAMIILKGPLREVDVYDAVQDTAKSEQTAVWFTGILEQLANVYVATFNPEHERWNTYPESARKAIKVFNLFNIRPMRPLILAVAAKMNQKEASRSFQFLVSLGVRLMIASNTRSGSVENPLAMTAKGVFDGTIETAQGLKKALASLTPTDQEFRSAFETARVSNAKLARYYLRSIELTAQSEAEPYFIPQNDQQIINLEHILPKKPEEHWPNWTEEDVRLYTTRLGNLALLRASDNSKLKSEAFSEKKKVYAACPYELTSQVAGLDEWTRDTITQRQKKLAQIAVKTWPARV